MKMPKFLLYLFICWLVISCNQSSKNPFDKTKALDLTTGNFNSQNIELVITNNNSTVLNGCILVNIEMDKNGQKAGEVKRLCSGPWQPKETKTINLDWDYYKNDNSGTGAGDYTFVTNSQVPENCN